jgi:hypothetical protein
MSLIILDAPPIAAPPARELAPVDREGVLEFSLKVLTYVGNLGKMLYTVENEVASVATHTLCSVQEVARTSGQESDHICL